MDPSNFFLTTSLVTLFVVDYHLYFCFQNPVLWGKRKYQDIQFYAEVGEITTDLGKYHHMQDRDDVQSEQLEREMRAKLDQTFQNFCDKVCFILNSTSYLLLLF